MTTKIYNNCFSRFMADIQDWQYSKPGSTGRYKNFHGTHQDKILEKLATTYLKTKEETNEEVLHRYPNPAPESTMESTIIQDLQARGIKVIDCQTSRVRASHSEYDAKQLEESLRTIALTYLKGADDKNDDDVIRSFFGDETLSLDSVNKALKEKNLSVAYKDDKKTKLVVYKKLPRWTIEHENQHPYLARITALVAPIFILGAMVQSSCSILNHTIGALFSFHVAEEEQWKFEYIGCEIMVFVGLTISLVATPVFGFIFGMHRAKTFLDCIPTGFITERMRQTSDTSATATQESLSPLASLSALSNSQPSHSIKVRYDFLTETTNQTEKHYVTISKSDLFSWWQKVINTYGHTKFSTNIYPQNLVELNIPTKTYVDTALKNVHTKRNEKYNEKNEFGRYNVEPSTDPSSSKILEDYNYQGTDGTQRTYTKLKNQHPVLTRVANCFSPIYAVAAIPQHLTGIVYDLTDRLMDVRVLGPLATRLFMPIISIYGIISPEGLFDSLKRNGILTTNYTRKKIKVVMRMMQNIGLLKKVIAQNKLVKEQIVSDAVRVGLSASGVSEHDITIFLQKTNSTEDTDYVPPPPEDDEKDKKEKDSELRDNSPHTDLFRTPSKSNAVASSSSPTLMEQIRTGKKLKEVPFQSPVTDAAKGQRSSGSLITPFLAKKLKQYRGYVEEDTKKNNGVAPHKEDDTDVADSEWE